MINIEEFIKESEKYPSTWRRDRITGMFSLAAGVTLDDLVIAYKNVWEWGLVGNKHLLLPDAVTKSGNSKLRSRCVYMLGDYVGECEKKYNYNAFINKFPGPHKSIVDQTNRMILLNAGGSAIRASLLFSSGSVQYLTLMTCGNGAWPVLKVWGGFVAGRVMYNEEKIEDVMKAGLEIIEEGNPVLFKSFDQDVFKKFVDELLKIEVKIK